MLFRSAAAELFRIVHQRSPGPDELALAREFLAVPAAAGAEASAPGAKAPLSRLAEFAQVMLLSNETAFVD